MEPVRRHALVTGAGSGLGRAIALCLASRGWRVALSGRTASRLEDTAREIARLPASAPARVLPADVTREGEVARIMEELGREGAGLDLLVHAAGYGRFESIEETSQQRFEQTLAVNLTAVFTVTRLALPLLAAGRAPVVAALNSVAARRAFPGCAAYGASKAGLQGLLGVMREELRGRGIRVLSVFAGATATPFWDAQAGSWDRSRMMSVADIARIVVDAVELPASVAVEEVMVRPAGGDL